MQANTKTHTKTNIIKNTQAPNHTDNNIHTVIYSHTNAYNTQSLSQTLMHRYTNTYMYIHIHI